MTAPRRPDPPATTPDLDTLFQAARIAEVGLKVVQHSTACHLSWRIPYDDWRSIRRITTGPRWAGAIQNRVFNDPPRTIDYLFGHPVTVVPPEPGRWPELVISIDRRN